MDSSDFRPTVPGRVRPTSAILARRIVFVFLAIICLGGIGIADFAPEKGFRYWLFAGAAFALASFVLGWSTAQGSGESVAGILFRRLLHWSALAAGYFLIFLLYNQERIGELEAGLLSLLALAIVTALAGVHMDWRFLVLGVILFVTFAAAILLTEFFWILAVPFLIVAIAAFFWQRKELRRGI